MTGPARLSFSAPASCTSYLSARWEGKGGIFVLCERLKGWFSRWVGLLFWFFSVLFAFVS